MHNSLPRDSADILRAASILRADHRFGAHALLKLAECPLCRRDDSVDLGLAVAHEAGEHLGRPTRDCGYCALYVLRPRPVAIARPARPLALPAPRRRQLAALPCGPIVRALPERATRRYIHREAWLAALRDLLRPAFEAAGAPIPTAVRVSCGFPIKGARPSKNQRIGECHYQRGGAQLFVSPVRDETADVAAILTHELIHAAHPTDGHGSAFGRTARKLGLTGSLTATSAGPATLALLAPILAQLGPYPHERIDLSGVKRQGTRMLKVTCPDCGYSLRTTAKWIAVGLPTCCCGADMVSDAAELDDDEPGVRLAACRAWR